MTHMNRYKAPESPSGYFLPMYVLPEGFDFAKEKESFAKEAFRKGMTIKEAENQWDSHCKGIIKKHDAAVDASIRKAESAYGEDVEMTPHQAEAEINRILQDKSHAYNNPTDLNHRAAVAFVNRATEIRNGTKTNFGGYMASLDAERREANQRNYGERSSRSYENVDDPAKRQNGDNKQAIGFETQDRSSAVGHRIEDGGGEE